MNKQIVINYLEYADSKGIEVILSENEENLTLKWIAEKNELFKKWIYNDDIPELISTELINFYVSNAQVAMQIEGKFAPIIFRTAVEAIEKYISESIHSLSFIKE